MIEYGPRQGQRAREGSHQGYSTRIGNTLSLGQVGLVKSGKLRLGQARFIKQELPLCQYFYHGPLNLTRTHWSNTSEGVRVPKLAPKN